MTREASMAANDEASASPGPGKKGPAAPDNPSGRAQFPADAAPQKDTAEIEQELDEALEQTFPASDPISFESTLVPGGRR
jgi:hypothetical protein